MSAHCSCEAPAASGQPGARFHAARIAYVRHVVDEHRECCASRLSYQIVARALRVYDRLDVPSTFAADVALILGMAPSDPDYRTNAARHARYLYRAINARSQRPASRVVERVIIHGERVAEIREIDPVLIQPARIGGSES